MKGLPSTTLMSCLSLLLVNGCSTIPAGRPSDTASLQEQVDAVCRRRHVPALAAAMTVDGRVADLAVAGIRKKGDPSRVMPDDQYHIGSCTKSMTALLAGLLVQEGRIAWTTTVAEVFSDRLARLDPGCRDITLEHLLTHQSGLLPFQDPSEDSRLWDLLVQQRGTPVDQRRALADYVLARPPLWKPGTHRAYSNVGYALAGALIEERIGEPWEELVRNRIFSPLGLQSGGFGAPGAPGLPPSQPWGHERIFGFTIAFEPGPDADNPPGLAPAGGVHLSVGDFARYAAFMVGASGGDRTWLNEDTARHLFEPAKEDGFAMGWIRHTLPGCFRPLLVHDGSNGRFYAFVVLDPERSRSLVVACNTGDARGASALLDIAQAWCTRP